MLDVHFVRENFDLVREKLSTRNFDPATLDNFTELDGVRRSIIRERDELNAASNRISKEVGALMREGKKDEAESKKAESRAVAEKVKGIEAKLDEMESEFRAILTSVPNLPHESVPVGADESANLEVRRWGTPRDFAAEGFEPKDHVDLGVGLGILDQERATKVTGARFAVLCGLGAKLERALINFMLDLHTTEHGYREMLPPFIVNDESLFGTGQLPKFEADLFKLRFERDYYLVPTAEVPLTNLHRDEILNEKDLTLSYTAYTPCFRSEAGSYGRDVRGLIRQHQFDKVELVKITRPEDSYEALERLTRDAETVLQRLGLPYRTVTLSTGDMGLLGGEDLRHRGLAAEPEDLPRNLFLLELRGVPGAPRADPLQARRQIEDRIRPHAERIGTGRRQDVDRDPGKLSTGRRLGDSSGSFDALLGRRCNHKRSSFRRPGKIK